MLEGGPSLQRRDHLIIISSSLGRVLRGGDNAQWDKSLLGDVEHFGVHRDNKVCVCVMGGEQKHHQPLVCTLQRERKRCCLRCNPGVWGSTVCARPVVPSSPDGHMLQLIDKCALNKYVSIKINML